MTARLHNGSDLRRWAGRLRLAFLRTLDRRGALKASVPVCASAMMFASMLLSSNTAQAQTDMSSFYADPAKYLLYGCKQLAEARPLLFYRIQNLERLMARASSGTGGSVASTMAYQNDYLAARGDLANLDERAADRRCPPMPQTAIAPPNEVTPEAAPPARGKPKR